MRMLTLYYKVLFMSDQNQPQVVHDLNQDVKDIKRLMERSTRFTTLSGASCIAAGISALAGAAVAYTIISDYYGEDPSNWRYSGNSFAVLKLKLLILAATVLAVASLTAFYFTWKKTKRQGLSLFEHSSKRVFWSMAIPMGAGALFVLGMLQQNEWRFVAPACLVFYGLALVNAGKYTLADIRYLGYSEIALGLINIFYVPNEFGYGLYFWAFGFGILHVVYGVIMWWKYDRNQASAGNK